MKMTSFAGRNFKEIVRDPVNLGLGLGFPLILLLLLSAIQANIPVALFEINKLAPGIAVFGLAFITLFAALLVSRDRESAFLVRLYTTPMTPADFIFGYMLPLIPVAFLQSLICYAAALCLGLGFSVNLIFALLAVIPISVFYVACGVLLGSVLTAKQSGVVSGTVFTNLAAWLSGVWFNLELVGGVFRDIANLLPFVHAVEIEKALVNGNFSDLLPHVLWVAGYAVVTTVVAILLFLRQMKKQ